MVVISLPSLCGPWKISFIRTIALPAVIVSISLPLYFNIKEVVIPLNLLDRSSNTKLLSYALTKLVVNASLIADLKNTLPLNLLLVVSPV